MSWNEILTLLWFFLPAGLANMAPVFAAKISGLKKLNFPLDAYKTFRGHRIFGDHKTFRGLIAGVLVGIITVFIQNKLFVNIESLRDSITIDYLKLNWVLLGSLLGAGAIVGDSVKSFFKRQVGIASGESWFFFDQIDYIIGGIVFSLAYIPLHVWQYLFIIILFFLLHIAVTSIGYVLRLKEKPY